jgi:hypothetical protein
VGGVEPGGVGMKTKPLLKVLNLYAGIGGKRREAETNKWGLRIVALIVFGIIVVALIIAFVNIVTQPVSAKCEITGWRPLQNGEKLGLYSMPNIDMVPTGSCSFNSSMVLFMFTRWRVGV